MRRRKDRNSLQQAVRTLRIVTRCPLRPRPLLLSKKNVTSGTGAQETKLSVFCIVLAANGSEPLSALPEKSAMKQASIGRVRDVRGGRTGGGRQFEG